MGRFINADALVSTGQGILGNNMFAYCGNNPATTVDPSGNAWCKISFDAFSPFDSSAVPMAGGGGGFMGAVFAMNSADSEIDQAIDEFDRYVNNTSEATVMNAKYFAFYKDTLVIKLPLTGLFDNSSASFGVIIMDNSLKNNADTANLLRHEYGHTVQLDQVGLVDYLAYFALPSMYYFIQTKRGKYTWDQYYDRPWELLADYFGQVKRTYPKEALNAAEQYWYSVLN